MGAGIKVSPRELVQQIDSQIGRVAEFKFIREFAEANGFRAYLFGGTAAGFSHYVKWNFLQKNGDSRFQADRFDFDFSSIYRSTQDADLVVDGTAADAKKLEEALQEKFAHVQGSKSSWEVRLLRKASGEKVALLENPDFLEQHTDSHSVGLIELTTPPIGESRVRDLKDLNSSQPQFLKDVAEGKLHYYFSMNHGDTSRAKNKLNPPILSVVRYFIKAVQYELEMRPSDLDVIIKIIEQFDPKDLPSTYVENWLIKNSRNLILYAVDIEYAWNLIEKVGLREKLLKLDHAKIENSLAWWLSREPLRSFKVGEGEGRTANELKIDVVAHETKDFMAYESITRSHQGIANVLVSREGFNGESALYGNGFYVQKGVKGARGSNITIRFRMNPNAREGSDFILSNDYLIIRNRNAIEVIPEYLQLNLEGYLALLKSGAIDSFDLGIKYKLDQRMSRLPLNLSNQEIERLLREFEEYCKDSKVLRPHWHKKVFEILAKTPRSLERIANAVDTLVMRVPIVFKDKVGVKYVPAYRATGWRGLGVHGIGAFRDPDSYSNSGEIPIHNIHVENVFSTDPLVVVETKHKIASELFDEDRLKAAFTDEKVRDFEWLSGEYLLPKTCLNELASLSGRK